LISSFGTVSVIIPTWNRADLLTRVLCDVGQQNYPIDQIIVVDNGSSDDSAAVAGRAGATVIRLSRNHGFAAAVNCGLRASSTDWVAILNNDTVIPPTWISTLVEEGSRTDSAFVTGKLLSAGDPGRIDGTFDLVSRAGATWRCGHGRQDGPFWDDPYVIQFTSLTAAVLKRSVIDEIGYLDERFESYLEDMDWCLRCAANGRTGRYVPSAIALHLGSATLGAWQKATAYLISRNQILLYRKHLRGMGAWPPLVGQLLWCVMAFRHRVGLAAVRGKLDGLRQFGAQPTESSECGLIRAAVRQSEQTIYQVQRQTGFDTYWRLYFYLTGK
jgi:GT2 family glycosyltransferase